MSVRRIVLTRRADADMDRLEAFLAAQSPGRAQRAIMRLQKGMSLLASFPELGVHLGSGYRQLALKYRTGGYIVRYRVSGDRVLITRIWHGKEKRDGK